MVAGSSYGEISYSCSVFLGSEVQILVSVAMEERLSSSCTKDSSFLHQE